MWYQQSSIGHAVIRIDDFIARRWEGWEMLNNAIEPGSHPQNVGGCWTGYSVYLPGTMPELEVPQFFKRDKWFYLLFSAHPQSWVDGPHVGSGGTFYVKSADPFKFEGHGQPLYATNAEELYSGRLLDVNDDLFFIAHHHTHHRYGGLMEPILVTVESNGDLQLEADNVARALHNCRMM